VWYILRQVIPRARVGYKLAVIMSTSASGIIVFLETPTKLLRMLIIFVEHGIFAHTPGVAKPMKTLELHNPMVQFFIIEIIPPAQVNLFCARFIRFIELLAVSDTISFWGKITANVWRKRRI